MFCEQFTTFLTPKEDTKSRDALLQYCLLDDVVWVAKQRGHSLLYHLMQSLQLCIVCCLETGTIATNIFPVKPLHYSN